MLKPNPSDATEFETTASDARTAARLAANRANAQHSTGPRSEDGKARSSQNAVKHGLFSSAVGHPAAPLEEERETFDLIVQEGRLRYGPVGMEEEMIVDRVAALWWELQRAFTQKQKFLRRRLDAGVPVEQAFKECNVFDGKEARLERSIRMERNDLVFLQRLRHGEQCKHTRWEREAHEKTMAALELERDRALFRLTDPPPTACGPVAPADTAPRPTAHSPIAQSPTAQPSTAHAFVAPPPVPHAPPPAPQERPQAAPGPVPHAAPLRDLDPARMAAPAGNGRRPEGPRGSGD